MSLLRALFSGLLFIALSTLIFWVVYSNGTPVNIYLIGMWQNEGFPLPFGWQGLPLGLWLVLFSLLGLFAGLMLGWFFAGQTRIRARQQTRRARRSESDLDASREEAEKAKTEIDSLEEALKRERAKAPKALTAPKN